MTQTQLMENFRGHFGEVAGQSLQLYFSPGRVNLIGEHTDYNGGFVFPAAITYGTYAVVRPRKERQIFLYSGNFPEAGQISFDLDAPTFNQKRNDWSVYVQGVMQTLVRAGHGLKVGFDAYIMGDIPHGSGLSSSASLELLFVEIFNELNGLAIGPVQKVKDAQSAEHYVGVMCGIMDQFAIGMGKAGHAIQLNTNTLAYTYAKAELGDYQILIMNTNKQRALAESKYNERRGECEGALKILQGEHPIDHLCDLSVAEFKATPAPIQNEGVLYRRAKHVITESERVLKAIEALEKGDLVTFGQLLNASHTSLQIDYEVTGVELDTLVSLAQEAEGVLGARMTGAGFGGCAIALVHKDHLSTVQSQINHGYTKAMGYAPSFYVSAIGAGTRRLV